MTIIFDPIDILCKSIFEHFSVSLSVSLLSARRNTKRAHKVIESSMYMDVLCADVENRRENKIDCNGMKIYALKSAMKCLLNGS